MAAPQLFLLSPARLDGVRGKQLLAESARFPLARALRTREGATIGEVFSFVSGLYFRGKLAYARRFAQPGDAPAWWGPGVLVITANRGLVRADTRICLEHLEAFAQTDIAAGEKSYRGPVTTDARLVRDGLGEGTVVLLGSIATPKYVDVMLETFGERVLFPRDFVGRGDMSRGSMLLRAAKEGTELPYAPLSLSSVRSTVRRRR